MSVVPNWPIDDNIYYPEHQILQTGGNIRYNLPFNLVNTDKTDVIRFTLECNTNGIGCGYSQQLKLARYNRGLRRKTDPPSKVYTHTIKQLVADINQVSTVSQLIEWKKKVDASDRVLFIYMFVSKINEEVAKSLRNTATFNPHTKTKTEPVHIGTGKDPVLRLAQLNSKSSSEKRKWVLASAIMVPPFHPTHPYSIVTTWKGAKKIEGKIRKAVTLAESYGLGVYIAPEYRYIKTKNYIPSPPFT